MKRWYNFEGVRALGLEKRDELIRSGRLDSTRQWLELSEDVGDQHGLAPAPKDAGPIRGMGDLAARVAQPIMRRVGKIIGKKLEDCGGCAERQEKWNEAFPFGKQDETKTDTTQEK